MSPQRVGLAADFPGDGLSGIGVYARELIRGLAGLEQMRLRVYYTGSQPSLLCGLPKLAETRIVRHGLPTTLAKSWHFHRQATDEQLVHETVQMGFLLPPRSAFKKVVTVFDIAPLHYPRNYSWYKGAFYRAAMRRSLLNADAVVTDSAHCRDDIQRTFAFPAQFMDKFTVTPLAADARYKPGEVSDEFRRQYGITDETFLFVGMLSPHKNLARVLDAFARLREERPGARLLVAGKRGWQCAREIQRMHALAPAVRWLEYVPDADLAQLYRAAAALVFPSLYEGFGLPIIEAQQSGCPVITARGGATEQTARGAAELVDANSADEIYRAMLGVLNDKLRVHELIAHGLENAALYSWQRTLHTTLSVYSRLLA